MDDETRMTIRLPGALASWLREMKEREGSTTNFEIIRSIRERMERVKAVAENSLQAGSATVPNNRALQGSASPTA